MKQLLNGLWKMKRIDEDKVYDAHVPTTMYKVLLDNKVIEDPFYGENDFKLTNLSNYSYAFFRTFDVNEELFQCERIDIEFLGLDTLASIFINNVQVGQTNNMHRTYRFNVKEHLVLGENYIYVKFDSPTEFIKKEQRKDPLWGLETTIDGYEHIRKAHCMFGWDWGPQLPDMGIWRDVYLLGRSEGELVDFYVKQVHSDDCVKLEIQISAKNIQENDKICIGIKDEQGNIISESVACSMTQFERSQTVAVIYDNDDNLYKATIKIDNPNLWWPNGYGEAYLYNLNISLENSSTVIDHIEKKIGLRTMTVTRETDQWGESFDITINGVRIFAMGADYIPEDALITRPTYESTERLIKDCARANYNCLRVWGGGCYPNDTFFDLCDKYGLIVWEDFMFACGVYRLTESFAKNIKAEFIDNIRRIRHHACLGLWCGNNEMEWAFVEWGLPKDKRLRMDYLLMYEKLIPNILAQYDPQTFYWPASPSSGGGFESPNADDRGDVHYWKVFHGNEHYKKFRDHYFRFASEYGMQAFPDIKTIKSYASEKDMNVFSSVMENHNKCIDPINGNIKILMNMSREFKLPNNFEDQVYVSQIFQAEAVKCAVEHFRRNRGRCMGSTYWQVNDNYPVASWASIDYYGRWKALHYYAKRFYSPLLVSAYEEGFVGHIHITNDMLFEFKGKVEWQIIHQKKGILKQGNEDFTISKLSTSHLRSIDIKEFVREYGEERDIYLAYKLKDKDDVIISSEILLFCYHKYFNFRKANIRFNVIADDGYSIEIISDQFTKGVTIDLEVGTAVLSNNSFDLLPNEKRIIKVEEWYDAKPSTLKELREQIKIMSINNLSY